MMTNEEMNATGMTQAELVADAVHDDCAQEQIERIKDCGYLVERGSWVEVLFGDDSRIVIMDSGWDVGFSGCSCACWPLANDGSHAHDCEDR